MTVKVFYKNIPFYCCDNGGNLLASTRCVLSANLKRRPHFLDDQQLLANEQEKRKLSQNEEKKREKDTKQAQHRACPSLSGCPTFSVSAVVIDW